MKTLIQQRTDILNKDGSIDINEHLDLRYDENGNYVVNFLNLDVELYVSSNVADAIIRKHVAEHGDLTPTTVITTNEGTIKPSVCPECGRMVAVNTDAGPDCPFATMFGKCSCGYMITESDFQEPDAVIT